MRKLSIYLKLLIFIPLIFIYLLLVNKGMVVYDPCAATPGRDFTLGIILLILFPFLAGGLLILCLRNDGLQIKRKFLVYGFLSVVCLILSTILSICALLATESILAGSNLYPLFFRIRVL